MGLWAITTFFNPCGHSPRKLDNFQRFAEGVRSQGAKLLVVECGFPDNGPTLWEIPREWTDRTVRTFSYSHLWQKERLLNHGLEALPDDCQHFAWIDADVLFENPHWVHDTIEALQNHTIVQLFEESRDEQTQPSIPVAQKTNSDRHLIAGHPGYAWAARREGFPGFYDKAVSGGGDTILAWAIYGHAGLWPGYGRAENYFSKAQLSDIIQWTAEFHAWSQADIGHVQGAIRHLPHGAKEYRRYLERLLVLKENEFDPETDLKLVAGVWEWNSNKAAMHERIFQYFQERNRSRMDVGKKVRVLHDGVWIEGAVVAKENADRADPDSFLYDVETREGLIRKVSDRHGNVEEMYA